jgi:hypothetical protein
VVRGENPQPGQGQLSRDTVSQGTLSLISILGRHDAEVRPAFKIVGNILNARRDCTLGQLFLAWLLFLDGGCGLVISNLR